jgi:hypothetical protein
MRAYALPSAFGFQRYPLSRMVHHSGLLKSQYRPVCSNGTAMRRSAFPFICAVQEYAECIRDRAEETAFFGSKYSAYLVTVK